MTKGSCLCGAVTLEITGPMRPVIACHCTQCRKGSGHHVAATSAARSDVEVTGELTWFQSSEYARRGFCGTCGAMMLWDGPDQNISIFAGCLDGPTGLHISGHIYCDDKGDYYEIADDVPQASGCDPKMTVQVRD